MKKCHNLFSILEELWMHMRQWLNKKKPGRMIFKDRLMLLEIPGSYHHMCCWVAWKPDNTSLPVVFQK